MQRRRGFAGVLRSGGVAGWLLVALLLPGLALAVPGTVTGVTATVVNSSQINLSWTAVATATSYRIYRCTGSSSCTPSTTVYATSATVSFSNTGLTSSTIHRYRLKAVDAAGGVSASYSSIVSGTTPAVTAPSALARTVISSSQINLTWTASSGMVSGYQVERCTGTACTPAPPAIATPAVNSYNNTGLLSNTSYRYRVRAYDAASNVSAYTSIVTGATPVVAAPTGLSATAASSSQINLSWTASTGVVTGYQVERCTPSVCTPATPAIATPATNSYGDTGLAASTGYSYRVRAYDAASNVSAYTTVASATTQAAADTTPPSAPTGLTATVVSASQINLSWTASTDNVAVTGYKVERCSGASCSSFAEIGTPGATSFSSTGLAAATNYSYRVRATDAANNLSAYSATASATTTALSSTYTYDTNGRLQTVSTPGVGTTTYTYDAVGNITSIVTVP